jgi:glutathione S-transferase
MKPKLELYFAPGACSFVPHVALEAIKAHSGQDFEPMLVKLHKGEHQTPEYLAMNPDGQVPMLVADGRPLTQIVAICEWLDRAFPQARLLPAEPWARAQALSRLAWMNNTVHPTFTHIFRPDKFADTDGGRAEIGRVATAQFRKYLERIQAWIGGTSELPIVHDAYAFTLLRWGGIAGIDPASLPAYRAYVERVMQAPAVAAALERERIKLDTYKT